MSKLCPTCQMTNADESRYCYRCGTALPAAGPALTVPPLAPTHVGPGVGPGATPAPETTARVAAGDLWGGSVVSPPPVGGGDAPLAPYPPAGMSGAAIPPPAWPAPGPAPTWPGNPGPLASPPTTPMPAPAGAAWRTIPPVAPAPRRPWFVIGAALIGGGLLLLLLAGVAGVALLQNNGLLTGRAGNAPATSLEAGLRAAVDASNQGQIQALRSLDAAPLQGVVTGKALADNQQLLDELRQSHVYAVSELQHIEYRAPKQIDADHASIRTLENWTTRYYDLTTKRLVRQTVSNGLDEVYYLLRQDNKWIVEQIDIHDPNATPSPGNTQ